MELKRINKEKINDNIIIKIGKEYYIVNDIIGIQLLKLFNEYKQYNKESHPFVSLKNKDVCIFCSDSFRGPNHAYYNINDNNKLEYYLKLCGCRENKMFGEIKCFMKECIKYDLSNIMKIIGHVNDQIVFMMNNNYIVNNDEYNKFLKISREYYTYNVRISHPYISDKYEICKVCKESYKHQNHKYYKSCISEDVDYYVKICGCYYTIITHDVLCKDHENIEIVK